MEKVSRYRGVSWVKKDNKWRATISFNKRQIYLGLFISDEDAFNHIVLTKKKLNEKEFGVNGSEILDGEIFKQLISYPMYEVSNLGRVKSCINGNFKILVPLKTTFNYRCVKIINKDNLCVRKTIHLLVAEAFLNHVSNGTFEVVVDHINGIKTDNRLENLQLLSNRENCLKAVRLNKVNKYICVYRTKKGTYKACIDFKGKKIHLGTFKNPEEGNEYYQNALKAIKKGEEIVVKRTIYSSKHIGVYFCKKKMKWTSTFKRKYIGTYSSEEEAFKAREEYIGKLNSNQ